MINFWDTLMARVQAGEMDMEEAHRRDNYYQFARHLPGLVDARGYVLDTPYEELPPVVFVLEGQGEEAFEHYVALVREGLITAYEAAQAYFNVVMS